MKVTAKLLAKLCLALSVISSVVLAQTAKTPKASNNTATKRADQLARSQADELREYQLLALREHVLSRILDNIKKTDEAGLRLSARNQLLTYLTSDKTASEVKQTLTTQVAREAITDLREHGAEILPFMFSYLSNDLGGWIQKHRPPLTGDFEKAVKANAKMDASQRIRSLFDLDGGDVLAAKRIRQELEERRALNSLHFWLDELMRRKSREFEPLAADILARASEGQISFETLFWISDIYLNPQTSDGLRKSFLALVVARTHSANFVAEPAPQMAYDLLTRTLPAIKHSTPELYDRALNEHMAMRSALNERQLAADARLKWLKESANPIEDLISEAESAKLKTERNELLLQAAQLALEKKRFERCLDILDDVDVSVAAPDPGSWQRSIDQLLKNLVKAVLSNKRVELAEKAAARIDSSLTRVEALTLIMRNYAKANEKTQAQRILTEATNVAASALDNTDKAKSFFLLSLTCDQVDGFKKTDLLLTGINALNNFAKLDHGPNDKTAYQDYVQRLDNSGYELTKGFKGLTEKNENDALALVEKLQQPDLRTFAWIGILLGLDRLLTEPI